MDKRKRQSTTQQSIAQESDGGCQNANFFLTPQRTRAKVRVPGRRKEAKNKKLGMRVTNFNERPADLKMTDIDGKKQRNSLQRQTECHG